MSAVANALLRRTRLFLTDQRRSALVRGAARRGMREVYRRRAAARPAPAPVPPVPPAPVPPAAPPVPPPPARPSTPFTTYYASPSATGLLEDVRSGRLEGPVDYLTTHVGRYAYLLDLIAGLGVRGSCLDVAGLPETRQLFEQRSDLERVDLTPMVDLDLDTWAERVGEGSYDLVVLSEVIEHLDADPALALHEINRALRPGAHLLLTTVNVGSELGVWNTWRGEAPYAMANIFGRRGDRHQREYAPKELQRLVAAHGFETWVTTANLYAPAAVKRTAHAWFEANAPLGSGPLHGDTNIVVGRKVAQSEAPRWLHPVYHESVAENRRDAVPEDVLARLRDGFPAELVHLAEYGVPRV